MGLPELLPQPQKSVSAACICDPFASVMWPQLSEKVRELPRWLSSYKTGFPTQRDRLPGTTPGKTLLHHHFLIEDRHGPEPRPRHSTLGCTANHSSLSWQPQCKEGNRITSSVKKQAENSPNLKVRNLKMTFEGQIKSQPSQPKGWGLSGTILCLWINYSHLSNVIWLPVWLQDQSGFRGQFTKSEFVLFNSNNRIEILNRDTIIWKWIYKFGTELQSTWNRGKIMKLKKF